MTKEPVTISFLVEQTGMTLKEFSLYFHIPYRTLQNWKEGSRIPPAYVLDLLWFKIQNDETLKRPSQS